MKGFEELIASFGFREGPFIVAILCIVVVLVNFMGGLFKNIILAMGGRQIVELPLVQRTSFRLAAATEFFFFAYIVYYHTILTSKIVIAQVIFWVFFLLAGPLLAMLGSQISYLGFKKKIEELKSEDYATEKEQPTERPQHLEEPQPSEGPAADPGG